MLNKYRITIIQLTVERPGFELQGFTNIQIFFKYCSAKQPALGQISRRRAMATEELRIWRVDYKLYSGFQLHGSFATLNPLSAQGSTVSTNQKNKPNKSDCFLMK